MRELESTLSGDLLLGSISFQYVFLNCIVQFNWSFKNFNDHSNIKINFSFTEGGIENRVIRDVFIERADSYYCSGMIGDNVLLSLIFLPKKSDCKSFFLSDALGKYKKSFLEYSKLLSLSLHSIGNEYPYFIPSLFPFKGDVYKEKIEFVRERNVVFLNGGEGVGKKTFLYSYLYWLNLENFNLFKSFEKRNISVFLNDYLYIPEIANLNQEECLYIVNIYKHIKKVFIYSIYNIEYIYQLGIIPLELYLICKRNLLAFPLKHLAEMPIISLMQLWKCFTPVQNIQLLVYNILGRTTVRSLITLRYKCLYYSSNYVFIDENKDLRLLIKEFDIFSIKYAVSKVGKSQQKISNLLGISRGSLQYKLRKYCLIL